MALDALLARLEGRAVTPVTADAIADVTQKPAPMLVCTPVTPVTAENDDTADKATGEPLPDSAKGEMLAFLLIAQRHGLTLADLKEAAGSDWPECERDPALLETLAAAVATRRMREAGIVPMYYTSTTTCAHCGSVPIFPGVPAHVLGCPWCFNRIAGKPMPAN